MKVQVCWKEEKYHNTRYKDEDSSLHYSKHGKVWKFSVKDATGYHVVGEEYATKAELLSDLKRYAEENWGY